MSQSNVIAGAIVIAFIIFITVRGELDDYLNLFAAKKKTAEASSSGDFIGGEGNNTLGGDIGTDDIANAAALFVKYGKYFV